MQTVDSCYGKVAALAGDPFKDWITPEYFLPLVDTAQSNAIQYLKNTCSPYIERIVIVPNVSVGVDPSNLVPFGVTSGGGQQKTYPLDGLVTPRDVDFKLPGTPANQFRPAKESNVLPDSVQQVTPQNYDIRVTGDFLPKPLTALDQIIEIHPNAAFALAYSVMALIGAERGNQGWIGEYGPQAKNAWDDIAADLVRQQQHLTFRIGSPNRQGRSGWAWNLQGCMGWNWRSYGLYVQLI